MSEQRGRAVAFVAKSFHEDDEAVARKIEAFLNDGLGYEITTGEPSEAREVSEKIRERIKAANLFVAVMTPYRRANEPRPSPWVVSELNYAHALDLPCIVLLSPSIPRSEIGGILADLETVELDPSRLDSVFQKIAEMERAARERLRRRRNEQAAAPRRDRAERLRAAYTAVLKSVLTARDLAAEVRFLREGETWEKKMRIIDEATAAAVREANEAVIALRLEQGTDEVVENYYGAWNSFTLYRLDVADMLRDRDLVPPEEIRKDRELLEKAVAAVEAAAKKHLAELDVR